MSEMVEVTPGRSYHKSIIEACAKAAHEANRAYCDALGDGSQVHWEQTPENIRESARNGVAGALAGNTPEQSHESWLAFKLKDGWVYGATKDVAAKIHPCMVPYAELPPEQQKKDQLFLCAVRSMATALGVPT